MTPADALAKAVLQYLDLRAAERSFDAARVRKSFRALAEAALAEKPEPALKTIPAGCSSTPWGVIPNAARGCPVLTEDLPANDTAIEGEKA